MKVIDGAVEIRGGKPLRGSLRLPGCKGVSHRALVVAATADGDSLLTHLGSGRDVASTRAALARLGVAIDDLEPGHVRVHGRGFPGLREPDGVVDCANSGTTMRFLAGLGAGRPFLTVLTGDASLSARPMARVLDPLRAMGATVDGRDDGRYPPLVVRGDALRGMRHVLPVASGQVKTALVLAGLQADGETEIVEPKPSRDHTERLLASLGVPVGRPDEQTTRVHAASVPPFDLDVPGDPSSAAFFVVAALLTPGSHVVLEEVLGNPGRLAYLDVLREMGADIVTHDRGTRGGEPVVDLEVRESALHGAVVRSQESIVDELPVLAVAGAFAEGTTEIVDAAELRVKESDRIASLVEELQKLGVTVDARADGMCVTGGARERSGDAVTLGSHGDHRIALAGAVAALARAGVTTVTGWDAVGVSYPEFGRHLEALGGDAR